MRYTSQADTHVMRGKSMSLATQVSRGYGRGLGALTTGIGSGNTASSAAAGASIGSSIGTMVVPVIGTAIGALVGGAVGAISAAFNRQDKENVNFSQAQTLAQQQGASAVLNLQNKYLVLAGLFDLTPSQIKGNIPIYKKYGRMGEFAFVTDMCNKVQAAANAGQLTENDTPQTVYSRIVLPWVAGFGFGSMSDSNGAMLDYIQMGMIAEFCANVYTQRWFAVGGQMPFGSLHPFTMPTATAPAQPQAVTGSKTPSPTAQAPAQMTELQRYQSGLTPQAGATINYSTNGTAFLQLPAPGSFLGIDPATKAWIVKINGSEYEMSGSTLVPYIRAGRLYPITPDTPDPGPVAGGATASGIYGSSPGTTPAGAPAAPEPSLPATVPTPDASSATDSSGNVIQTQYIPAASNSGYYPPAPLAAGALVTVPVAGDDNDMMLLLVAGAAALYFAMAGRK